MIGSVLLLVLGFVFLIKGADIFVDGASSTAQNFKAPKILIGLTIVAFGTSAPEFAVSMSALATGHTDMVLGNVIGSNILNILLILGVAALICPIHIKDNTVKKELPLISLISTLLVVVFLDVKLAGASTNQITRSDAFVILLFFSVFIYYLMTLVTSSKNKEKEEKAAHSIGISLLFVVLGLAGIILGSNMVVDNAKKIAEALGLSDRLISLTIIAFGTSLPELITTIVSSKKKEQDLLLGNVIGSNIFNICVVLGIPVAIYGTVTPVSFQALDLIMLLTSSFVLYLFATTRRTITRLEGSLLLFLFSIYYIVIFL